MAHCTCTATALTAKPSPALCLTPKQHPLSPYLRRPQKPKLSHQPLTREAPKRCRSSPSFWLLKAFRGVV